MHSSVMGAVLCGGASSRFGRPKAIAEIGDNVLMGHIAIRSLRAAGVDPVVAVGGSYSPDLGIPTITDRWPGAGPLAGIATALLYTTQPHVLAVPCDLPLLTGQHLADLGSPDNANSAVVAEVDGIVEPSIGLWPRAWARELATEVRSGKRRLQDLLDLGPYTTSVIEPDALLDADTPTEFQLLIERFREGNL